MKAEFDIDLENMKNIEDKYKDRLKKVLWLSMNKVDEIASRIVPVDTGRLKNSIFVYPMRAGSSEYIVADGVEYGAYVEFGTSPHIILPKTKKALRWKDKDTKQDVFAKRVFHPGTNAQPFFRPALKEVKDIWQYRYFKEVFKDLS